MTGTMKSLFVFVLLAMFIAMIPMAMQASEGMSQLVRSLPLTEHAKVSHAEQTWNATTIQEYMNNGGCIPKEYSCMAKDITVRYCELNGKLSIGLVIGYTAEKIITGFAGPTKYWKSRCK